jgi:hypothetical protein
MAKKRPPPSTRAKASSPDDPARIWTDRLARAKKDYDAWAKEYEVERCLQYYLGRHWRGYSEEQAQKKYTINLIFATLETQLPALMFGTPRVIVEPRPARAQQPGSDVGGRATLLESTLQTFVDDRDVQFSFETTLALRDAYSHYALVEVGYSADWIDNPNADKPVLKENGTDPLLDEDRNPVLQPKKIIKPGTGESLFLKRIPPHTFRVWPGRNALVKNDAVAYYEWHYVADVKANKEYDHTADLKATGTVSTDADAPTDEADSQKYQGMVKLWKIWDLRKKVRHVLAEGHPQLLQQDKSYTYLPLAALKFYEIPNSWYPLPAIFNWLSPQDEINETREGMRTHRRRFARRYMREPSVLKTEFEKLETGEDGTCIEVPKVNPSPIMPIPDADLSAQNTVQELAVTKDDFAQITGVSGEARGVPQADTATAANIINVRQQVRESRTRRLVADWLGEILRLMMLTIKEKMQLPMVIKMNTDPFALAPKPSEPGDRTGDRVTRALYRPLQEWKEIKAEDLGDLDVDVKVDLSSLSPVAEAAQAQAWNIVLQLLTNIPLLMLLMTPNPEAPDEPSPMLRKTLALNGIKSDTEVREIWRVGQVVLQQHALMAMAAAASGKGGGAGMPGLSMMPGGVATPATPGPVTGAPAAGPVTGGA